MADLFPEIEAALEAHLQGITDIPDIAWENGNYVPTVGVSYVEAFHIPTSREPATRGNAFRTKYQGVFRIECVVPSDKGTGAARDLTSKVITAFDNNTDLLLSSGKYATTRYATKETGTKEGAFYRVPVNIGWYSYD